ncbi:phosphate/phosphite/phosphonate ABC transporter substrate-binding protein [Neorhizobium alkalisoli]|uniref:phosphate/phosphite/phosphonate ABC transporter substrate-binding protein n=1 Tax=Neorhizobium alkalisoli TaxID=528178 RepID=UPI0032B13920
MKLRLASLAMYVAPKPVEEATDAFWAFIRDYLRQAGLADVPDMIDRSVAYDHAWARPDLLLSQICGHPYAATFRDRVRLIATPCYSYRGCDGPNTRSLIIMRKDAGYTSLADLRGRVAAVNSFESNSGTNVFRAAIAPFANGQKFFDRVFEAGAHVASIAAVSEGRADCAAIDCVTFGHLNRFAPQLLDRVTVLDETPSGPGLAMITAISTSDDDVAVLRAALFAALSEPALADVRDTLALVGFEVLSDADYEALLDLERQAAALGYPELA